jgi:hypothetical protein
VSEKDYHAPLKRPQLPGINPRIKEDAHGCSAFAVCVDGTQRRVAFDRHSNYTWGTRQPRRNLRPNLALSIEADQTLQQKHGCRRGADLVCDRAARAGAQCGVPRPFDAGCGHILKAPQALDALGFDVRHPPDDCKIKGVAVIAGSSPCLLEHQHLEDSHCC